MCKHTRQRTGHQIHAVNARDEGRCTFVDENGKRCNEEWWTAHHHIKHFAGGGGNGPENMTTLCAHHHDLVHQTSFPIVGQISWLRSTFVPYRAQPTAVGS